MNVVSKPLTRVSLIKSQVPKFPNVIQNPTLFCCQRAYRVNTEPLPFACGKKVLSGASTLVTLCWLSDWSVSLALPCSVPTCSALSEECALSGISLRSVPCCLLMCPWESPPGSHPNLWTEATNQELWSLNWEFSFQDVSFGEMDLQGCILRWAASQQKATHCSIPSVCLHKSMLHHLGKPPQGINCIVVFTSASRKSHFWSPTHCNLASISSSCAVG